MTTRLVPIVLFASLVLGGCARSIVWEERQGTESAALVPTCWNCERVVEFQTDECLACGADYRWVGRPGEEE